MDVVALVPMRHDSERVPQKNYRPLNGTPLCLHIVRSLLDVAAVREVLIDTDSPAVASILGGLGDRVRVIDRPPELLGGDVPMNAIIEHDLGRADGDWFLQTHSTNPLLRAATIERAIDALDASLDDHDSLFSVTPRQTRYWWPDGRPVNHDPDVLLRTQDLPPLLEENSNLYVFERATFMKRRNRIGERPLLFRIDADEAWDIDEELDFTIAELLHRERLQ